MTSKRKENTLSPIPKVVEVTPDDSNDSSLRYGASTPGHMAKTANVVTPLSLFETSGRYFKQQPNLDSSMEEDDKSSIASRLGIRKPSYGRDDEASRAQSASSFRIGITRPSYEVPDGEVPMTPLNLYLQKKAVSPTPNLIELDSEDSADPFAAWTIERISEVPSRDEDDAVPDVDHDDDSIDRMIHEQTAEGHYLVGSTPVTKPSDDIQFSIDKRRREQPKWMKRASERHIARNPKSTSEAYASHAPDAYFKIFILLLNPRAKIFELIQVIYAPSVTTIGDILEMIPANATEPALGSQSYIGLCRPKDGFEITDTQLMASGSHCKMSCARIIRGEILVAVTAGYNGKQCANLAVPILANHRILKLLQKSDPLAANRKMKKRRSSSHRSSSRHARVETVKEEPEVERSPSHREFNQAMKHAVAAAAAANAALLDHEREDMPTSSSSSVGPVEEWRYSPNFDLTASMTFDSTADDHSLNDSYASSVASNSSSYQQADLTFNSHSRRLPRRRVSRRKHRRLTRNYYVGRISAAAAVIMVGIFMADADAPRDRDDMTKAFGWIGLLQFLTVFCALVKLQRYSKSRDATNCPFVRLSMDAASHLSEQMAAQRNHAHE